MATATKTKRKPAPAAAAPASEKKAAAAAKPETPKPARKASPKPSAKAKAETQPQPAAPSAQTRPKAPKTKPKTKAKPKAPAIPPYRSDGLIRGPLVSDTLQALQGWDLEASKRANLDLLRQSNSIGAPTQAWLKKVCSALSARFDPAGRDRALVLAARTGTGQRHWKPSAALAPGQ